MRKVIAQAGAPERCPRLWIPLLVLVAAACGGAESDNSVAVAGSGDDAQGHHHDFDGFCVGPVPPSVRVERRGIAAEVQDEGVTRVIYEARLVDHRGEEHAVTIQYGPLGTATEDQLSERFSASFRAPSYRSPPPTMSNAEGGAVVQRRTRGALLLGTYCRANGRVSIAGLHGGDTWVRDQYAVRIRPCPCDHYLASR